MFHLLFVSPSQMTIGSIDAMHFGAETCGLPPDFRPLGKAAVRFASILKSCRSVPGHFLPLRQIE